MKKKAILVIDMLKDTLGKNKKSPLALQGAALLPTLNHLIKKSRDTGIQVIFAMDSFLENDYFFSRGVKPYSIRGTEGAEVINEIEKDPRDMYLPKRRFSAFFKTDLDQTLRVMGIDTVVLTGITTHVCVLATAMDALSHDFKTIIIEDCCASVSKDIHQSIISTYRNSSLAPFLKVMTSEEFLAQSSQEV